MGCICSEVVYSAKDENALEQPYKSGQQFLGTSGRDDMVVELDSGSDGPDDDGRLISEGNKENVVASQIILPEFGDKKHVVAEKSELHVAQRPKKIYIEGNVRVHSIKVIADGVQNTCEWLSWLTSVARDSTKARFLQMLLSKDELDKGAILGDSRKFCFLPVHAKRGMTNVQSNEYLEESSNHYIIRYGDDMDRSRKLLLKEDPAYLGVDVSFLDDLAEEARSYNVLAFKVSGNKDWWLYSLLNQCSIPRVDAVFISCVTTFISERNACYLPESASFLAPDSGNLFFLLASDFLFIDSLYTRENLELLLDLPFCITITGDTVIGPYNEQCISAISNTSESVESVLMRALRVLQQDSLVIEALKETNFVTNANGDLYKPKDLFDPGDSLLTSVFSSDVHMFPRERFATDGWLNILRKTGLQNTGDADIVLECVRRVELLGSKSMNPLGLVDDCNMEDSLDTRAEVSLEIWSLAETLITAIFENFSVLYGNKFCNILGKIACIPAKRGKKRVLCSYSEAILMKDWALTWSSSPVLFRESLVPPEYSWEALQLRSPPHFDRVLKHLQAGLLSDSTLSNLEESTFEVLKYLDSIWPTLSSSDILELKQVAFIAVDNRTHLVTSGSLFTHLSKNLSPLASKIPPGYVPFVKILRELGSEDKLCVSTAINILLRLQNSCDRLNPNELHAVIEILDFLCNETIEQQTSDRPTWQSELVVPDDGCRFVHANSSVYIDRYGSQYVKFIDSSQLRFVHRDVSERMCLAFGIRKLSDVVVEELDCVKRLQTREEIGSVSLAAIKQKLLSWSFQVAVSRVFYTVSSSTIGSENPDFQTIQSVRHWPSIKSVS